MSRFFIILLLIVGCGGRSDTAQQTIEEPFILSIEVEFGEDRGQGLGTLFEAKDSNGKTLFGAGFQDSCSTRIRDNNRLLTFFVTGQAEHQIEALGNPFGSKQNATRLFAYTEGITPFYYDNPLLIDEIQVPRVFGVQYIGGKRLEFIDRGTQIDITFVGVVIHSTTDTFPQFYYSKGILLLYYYDLQRIYVGPWDFTEGRNIDLEAFTAFQIEGFPYTYASYRDELIFATNLGVLYSLQNGELRVIRKANDQLYSIINVNGQLLLGHYPSGSLYIYDDYGFREFSPSIPVPENAYPDYREAQTLTLFGGQLYAGLWPWGELWRFDFDARQWHFVSRLFTMPEVSFSPYYPYGEARWGQRIVSMVPYGNALYASTMNQVGNPYSPEQAPFITIEAVQEYGQIYRIRGPLQITAPISWRSNTTFQFRIAAGKLEMYQDGVMLGETEYPALGRCGEVKTITLNEGIYGSFGGVNITIAPNPNKEARQVLK